MFHNAGRYDIIRLPHKAGLHPSLSGWGVTRLSYLSMFLSLCQISKINAIIVRYFMRFSIILSISIIPFTSFLWFNYTTYLRGCQHLFQEIIKKFLNWTTNEVTKCVIMIVSHSDKGRSPQSLRPFSCAI